MEKKLNGFMEKLTRNHKDILADRGELLNSTAVRAQKDLISELEGRRDAVLTEILRLSDMSPRETTSLNFVDKFNAKEWVTNLHNLEIQKLDLELELQVANRNFDKWFKVPEDVEEKGKEA
jgi:hypothetical protein